MRARRLLPLGHAAERARHASSIRASVRLPSIRCHGCPPSLSYYRASPINRANRAPRSSRLTTSLSPRAQQRLAFSIASSRQGLCRGAARGPRSNAQRRPPPALCRDSPTKIARSPPAYGRGRCLCEPVITDSLRPARRSARRCARPGARARRRGAQHDHTFPPPTIGSSADSPRHQRRLPRPCRRDNRAYVLRRATLLQSGQHAVDCSRSSWLPNV